MAYSKLKHIDEKKNERRDGLRKSKYKNRRRNLIHKPVETSNIKHMEDIEGEKSKEREEHRKRSIKQNTT